MYISANCSCRILQKRSFFLASLQDLPRSCKILRDLMGFCRNLAQNSFKIPAKPCKIPQDLTGSCKDARKGIFSCKILQEHFYWEFGPQIDLNFRQTSLRNSMLVWPMADGLWTHSYSKYCHHGCVCPTCPSHHALTSHPIPPTSLLCFLCYCCYIYYYYCYIIYLCYNYYLTGLKQLLVHN